MTVLLFTPIFVSCYFYFPHQGMQLIMLLFSQKYKKDVSFLFTAGDKWNAAKYSDENRRGTILFYTKHKFSFH